MPSHSEVHFCKARWGRLRKNPQHQASKILFATKCELITYLGLLRPFSIRLFSCFALRFSFLGKKPWMFIDVFPLLKWSLFLELVYIFLSNTRHSNRAGAWQQNWTQNRDLEVKLSYKCEEKEAHQAVINMNYANQQTKKLNESSSSQPLVLSEIISNRGDNFCDAIILNISLIRRNY